MNLLTIKNLTKSYTGKVLFDSTDFSLSEGEKVGIVGINGTGKSTLLKIIAGLSEPDGGEYVKGSHVQINYLPQMPEFIPGITLCDYVAGNGDESWLLQGEAKNILTRLGFDDVHVVIDNLSGGQKKKAALAKALINKSELLLLDEPTNHLDSETAEWLEEELNAYRGAIIMVTHDRYFLDLICSRIVEIDKGKLYSYKENYEGFLNLKAEREAMALSTQKKHENILRKELAWISRGAKARSTKQKARIERYEELRDEKKIEAETGAQIDAVSSRLGKKTVLLHHISKAYDGKTLINDLDFIFLKDDRIGILGPNGCGKTTLIKMITGAIVPDRGYVETGDTVKIGWYAQTTEAMDPSERVIDYIKDTAEYIKSDDGYISASQMLEKFLFDSILQYQKIEKLSGGEKRRLYLAKVLMEAPNVLILDEPTNDLDIKTLRILEDYLDTFRGIVIEVSHDRYFLDRTARRMLTFTGNGEVALFNGTYTEYYLLMKEKEQELKRQAKLEAKQGNASAAPSPKPSAPKKLKFTFSEKREYETIEADIEKLENEINDVEAALANPSISSDFVKLTELTKKDEELNEKLEHLMERYVYLEELNEKINSQ